MTHLDDAALDAIEQRADAATQGPWRSEWDADEKFADVRGGGPMGSMRECQVAACVPMGRPNTQPIADAEFIAHARTDIPALLAAVRDAQRRAQAAEAALQRVREVADNLHSAQYAPVIVHALRRALDMPTEAQKKPPLE